jgi:hypothetical protein
MTTTSQSRLLRSASQVRSSPRSDRQWRSWCTRPLPSTPRSLDDGRQLAERTKRRAVMPSCSPRRAAAHRGPGMSARNRFTCSRAAWRSSRPRAGGCGPWPRSGRARRSSWRRGSRTLLATSAACPCDSWCRPARQDDELLRRSGSAGSGRAQRPEHSAARPRRVGGDRRASSNPVRAGLGRPSGAQLRTRGRRCSTQPLRTHQSASEILSSDRETRAIARTTGEGPALQSDLSER